KVVEHQTRYSDRLQIIDSRRRGQARIEGILRMKCQRNKALEPARLILKRAKTNQVIHSLFDRLNVSVKHRCVGANARLVHRTANFEPAITGNLVPRNQRPRTLCEDFGSTSRAASKSGLANFVNDPIQRLSRDLREEVQLNHREGLQMDARKTIAHP